MATKRICSVANCGKPHFGHGFCNRHYKRWRKFGDPLIGGTPKGDVPKFISDLSDANTTECILWPYATRKGESVVNINGVVQSVTRLLCEAENGPPLTVEYEAAHECGNGHLWCVNPKHLTWKTPIANAADKRRHGTHLQGEQIPTSKLTEEQVRAIRSDNVSLLRDLAAKYEVTESTISVIRNVKSGVWLR